MFSPPMRFHLHLSEENEDIVREFLMLRWSTNWRYKRKLHTELEMSSRFTKKEYPLDLSGACRIANMFAHAAFDLDGDFHANSSHAFTIMRDGTIYDLNRKCADVAALKLKGNPYKIDHEFYNSSKTQKKVSSWDIMLLEWCQDFDFFTKHAHLPTNTGGSVDSVPLWAKN